MSYYLRADLAGCLSSGRIALSIEAVFVRHNQVCVFRLEKYLEFFVLGYFVQFILL